MKIQLTVTKRDGKVITPGKLLGFEPSTLTNVESTPNGTRFEVLGDINRNNDSVVYECSESLSAVLTTLASVDVNIKKSVVLVFDATGGKAIAAYDLKDVNGNPFTLPKSSRVVRAEYEVVITFVSAGSDAGTISLGIPVDDVAGIKAAIAISNGANPWDAGAMVATIQDGALANYSEKTTDSRKIQATVAGQVLTAGKMFVVVDYITTGIA